jgi:hypothetical protein
MSDVALIDAGGANLGSVRYALERLGVEARLVRDAAGLQGADRVILPGVGAAPHAMARLREQGLIEPLRALQVPLIGICLGMQLLFEHSEEGDVDCLGLLTGMVRHMNPQVAAVLGGDLRVAETYATAETVTNWYRTRWGLEFSITGRNRRSNNLPAWVASTMPRALAAKQAENCCGERPKPSCNRNGDAAM